MGRVQAQVISAIAFVIRIGAGGGEREVIVLGKNVLPCFAA
jgi:hypothetical protein